jgi:hypothetical protein
MSDLPKIHIKMTTVCKVHGPIDERVYSDPSITPIISQCPKCGGSQQLELITNNDLTAALDAGKDTK